MYKEKAESKTSSSENEGSQGVNNYWRSNLKCLGVLLSIWFLVSFGGGILFVDWLDNFRIPGTGFKLGFWIAQQGSIYVFVVLILIYVIYMNRLDRKYGLIEETSKKEKTGEDFEI